MSSSTSGTTNILLNSRCRIQNEAILFISLIFSLRLSLGRVFLSLSLSLSFFLLLLLLQLNKAFPSGI